ncbi:Polysaccharide pyruvyl transferase [Opitutaceae bacterium TAV1]|nr:Polysaccharide pyruvyl transferase [Opitutaceae bacterium TAV1]
MSATLVTPPPVARLCNPAANHPLRCPHVLVRSSWQTVNIGDIGHTPGLLRLLETHLPHARITLWAGDVSGGVGDMLRRDFPAVEILDDRAAPDGFPTTDVVRHAWDEADFFIHGSGPYIVARHILEAWASTGRPYGVYGVTLESFDPELVALLDGADFVFCRDTVSLRAARAAGVRTRRLEFAPDAAFAADDRDDAAADAFLSAHGLEAGRFLCVISRLRHTPYFRIRNRPATPRELGLAAISDTHKESDHERLRIVMIRWIRETGMKVLVCPEMTYEIELTKEQLVDRMPPDARPHVVWRGTYWHPDEATSVYARALAMVSMEMHSPILACAADTPAIYLRLPTDTCKGQMWRDIGLPEWMFEIGECDGDAISETLLQLVAEPRRTAMRMAHARQRVAFLQVHSMGIVRECVERRAAGTAPRGA